MQLPSFKLSLQLLTPVLTDIKRQIYNLFPVLNKGPATVASGADSGAAITTPSPVAIQIKSKYSLNHSLTHLLTRLLTHSPAYLLTYSLTYSLTHSPAYLLTHSLPLG
jgi:hypothetical protein